MQGHNHPLRPADQANDPNSAFDELDDVVQEDRQEGTRSTAQQSPPTEYRHGTGRRMLLLTGSFAALLIVGFLIVYQSRSRADAELAKESSISAAQPPTVTAVKAQLAPPTQTLTLPGETAGWYSSTIYARVNGYLAKWFVDIGDRVRTGEVLATIDTPELDAQLEAAQAQLSVSEADVKAKQADADFAKTTYDRWQGSPKGVVSEQEREDKKARYQTAIAELNAAEARVKLDQANVDRLEKLTQFKNVTAPFEGVITERRVDIGDLITAGSTSNTSPLFGIAQTDKIRVFVNVPQAASLQLETGSPAQIVSKEFPDRGFQGKVSRTSESIDPKARTLLVQVDLDNSDLALLPGMYVSVELHLKPATLVEVPASALVFRAEGPQVAMITPENTIKFTNVVIGRDKGHLIDISSGLQPGDRVALNINNQIADGESVNVAEAEGELPTASK